MPSSSELELGLINNNFSSDLRNITNTPTKGPNLINLLFKNKIKTPLEYVEEKDIEYGKHLNIRAKAHYLYWACFRGRIDLVKHILETDKISPFYRIYEGRSPIMASLIGKHAPMSVSVILSLDSLK